MLFIKSVREESESDSESPERESSKDAVALSDPVASSMAASKEAKVLDDVSAEVVDDEEAEVVVEVFAVLLYNEVSRLDKLEMLDIYHTSFKIQII